MRDSINDERVIDGCFYFNQITATLFYLSHTLAGGRVEILFLRLVYLLFIISGVSIFIFIISCYFLSYYFRIFYYGPEGAGKR